MERRIYSPDPHNKEKFKTVKDLSKEDQKNFVVADGEGEIKEGFVPKTASDLYAEAEIVAEIANRQRDVHPSVGDRIVEPEELKIRPVDVLHQKANEINEDGRKLHKEKEEINHAISHEEMKFLILEQLEEKGFASFEIPDEVLEDRDFAIKAVKIDGMLLEKFPEKFKSDKEIVLEAVRQNERAMYFASDSIKEEIEKLLRN